MEDLAAEEAEHYLRVSRRPVSLLPASILTSPWSSASPLLMSGKAPAPTHGPAPAPTPAPATAPARSGVAVLHSTTDIAADLARLRSIYQAVRIFRSREIDRLQELPEDDALRFLQSAAEDLEIPGLGPGTTVAVRVRRRGTHRFRSPAAERALGTTVVGQYRCPVDLVAPMVTMRVDITENMVDLGILVTPPEMDHRYTWLYRPRVTLSPVTAYALLHTSRIDRSERDEVILDPFCGSGTIPIEIAHASPAHAPPAHAPLTRTPLYAADLAAEAIAGTRANLAANGLENRVVTRCLDATDPDSFRSVWQNRGITTILCNPPYGVRLGKRVDFTRFYRGFLTGAAQVLPPRGRLVIMSSRRRGALNSVLATMSEWRTVHVRVVETGGVFPGIFLLERR